MYTDLSLLSLSEKAFELSHEYLRGGFILSFDVVVVPDAG
jgi:hypothetical protein